MAHVMDKWPWPAGSIPFTGTDGLISLHLFNTFGLDQLCSIPLHLEQLVQSHVIDVCMSCLFLYGAKCRKMRRDM